MIEYNLNKTVYVRLNNTGRDIYKNYIKLSMDIYLVYI